MSRQPDMWRAVTSDSPQNFAYYLNGLEAEGWRVVLVYVSKDGAAAILTKHKPGEI